MEVKIELEELRKKKIFIGMPMYGGLCYGETAKSLINLQRVCSQYQIPLETYFLMNESLVQRARNYSVDAFLRTDYEIFMFIDADIQFEPMDVLVLAHLMCTNENYDVICAPYSKKTIAFEKIKDAVDKGRADEDPNELANYVGDYVFNFHPDTKQIKTDEPFKVSEAGTGFMMFDRKLLEEFKEFYPELSYLPDHVRQKHFDGSREIGLFFHTEIDPESKRYLSEDYWFCRKVSNMGKNIYMVPWMRLGHIGTYKFQGSLPHLISIGASATADKSKIKKK